MSWFTHRCQQSRADNGSSFEPLTSYIVAAEAGHELQAKIQVTIFT
jgi:hypothetical protein